MAMYMTVPEQEVEVPEMSQVKPEVVIEPQRILIDDYIYISNNTDKDKRRYGSKREIKITRSGIGIIDWGNSIINDQVASNNARN